MFYTVNSNHCCIIIFTLVLCIHGTIAAQSPDWLWAKATGGPGNSRAYSIAVDPGGSGNIYLTGIFSGKVDFDPGADSFYLTAVGNVDIFISKLDKEGDFVWAKAIGGTGYDIGISIAIDPDGNGDVYTTGYFETTVDFDPGPDTFNLISAGTSDIFISKLDSAGNFLWARTIGGTGKDYGQAITVDSAGSGDIFITGSFSETVDFDPGVGTYYLTSAGFDDIFVSKMNGSGNFIWAKAMAGKKIDRGYSIAIDPGGSEDVYMAGKFTGKVDFDPGADSFYLNSHLSPYIFISKLDGSGNLKWAKALSGNSLDYSSTSLAIDPAGNGHVYTAGNLIGTVDFDPGPDTFDIVADGFADLFISALDGAGQFEWTNAIGGPGADGCLSIVLDPAGSGEVFTTGMFEGTVDFDPGAGTSDLTAEGLDIYISKSDDSGNFIWAKSATGSKEDIGFSVAADAFGQAYVAGYFYSPTISFDSISLQNSDSTGSTSNIFIAKLGAVTTSIAHAESGKRPILIYPNPAKNELTLRINEDNHKTIAITIYSITGEVVLSIQAQNLGQEQAIDISSLPEGLYFVATIADGIRMVNKMVKE